MNGPAPLPPAEILAPNVPGAAAGAAAELPADGRIAATFAALLQVARLESGSREASTGDEIPEEPMLERDSRAGASETPPNVLDGLLFLAHVHVAQPEPRVASDTTAIAGGAASRRTMVSAGADAIESAADEAAESADAALKDLATSALDADDAVLRSAAEAARAAAFREARVLAKAGEAAAASASDLAVEPASGTHHPTPAPATAASQGPVVVSIATPVHGAGWHEETAQRIVSLVTRGAERAELRLSPAELGPVDLRIEIKGSEATLMIVAAHATTRDALEQALPMLRDLLAQQGLALGEASVHDGKAEQQASGGERSSSPFAFRDEAADVPPDTQRPITHRLGAGVRLIDTFA